MAAGCRILAETDNLVLVGEDSLGLAGCSSGRSHHRTG